MEDAMAKASGEFWVLLGSGMGIALAAVLLALIGSLREWLFGLIPKLIAKMKSYPTKKDAEQNQRVYTELVELRVLTDADRSYVMRFHNGSEFLPDNSAWKISCTHETVRSGISYESAQLQEILVSRVHNLVDSVITGEAKYLGVKVVDCGQCQFKSTCNRENKHIVVIQVDELENSYGKFLLESQNIKTIVQVGVVIDNKVIGIVGIDICDGKLADDTLIKEASGRVCRSAEKIRYYLQFKDIPSPLPLR
jgi:hypothetical protein